MLCIQVWFKSPPVFHLTDQIPWSLTGIITDQNSYFCQVLCGSTFAKMSLQHTHVDGKCTFEIVPSISRKILVYFHVVNSDAVKSLVFFFLALMQRERQPNNSTENIFHFK